MIRACSSFVAILSALTIAFAASQPAAALVNAPQIARPADPVILIAGTRVGDMTPQMRTAYIRGLQEELATHDYHPGPADGLPVSGAVDNALLDALGPLAGEPAAAELPDSVDVAEESAVELGEAAQEEEPLFVTPAPPPAD